VVIDQCINGGHKLFNRWVHLNVVLRLRPIRSAGVKVLVVLSEMLNPTGFLPAVDDWSACRILQLLSQPPAGMPQVGAHGVGPPVM
jgi:hypothetical protein